MEGEIPLTGISDAEQRFRSNFGCVKRVDESGTCGKSEPGDGYEHRRVSHNTKESHSEYVE